MPHPLRWHTPSRQAATAVLIGNALVFNLGFYMVLPYVASHLSQDLGFTAASVGLVLGLRVFCQQGLFLLGGWLGDMHGYRWTIIAGCAVRTAGFWLLGSTTQFSGLLLGAALSGFGGALFTPTAQAYLSRLYPDDASRRRVFAWHHWMSSAGMLLGPVVGLWTTTGFGFSAAAVAAGTLFGALTLLQWRALPPDAHALVPTYDSHAPQAAPTEHLLLHTAFWWFSLLGAAYAVLFHQLYLAVPAWIQARHGDADLIGTLFTAVALLGILLQWPISRWQTRHLPPAHAMGWGLACMGLAYLCLLNPLQLDDLWAIYLLALLLSAGSALASPLLNAEISLYAPERSRARYYGFFAGIGGLSALVSNLLIGYALTHNPGPSPALWWCLCATGVGGGWALYRHSQRQWEKGCTDKLELK